MMKRTISYYLSRRTGKTNCVHAISKRYRSGILGLGWVTRISILLNIVLVSLAIIFIQQSLLYQELYLEEAQDNRHAILDQQQAIAYTNAWSEVVIKQNHEITTLKALIEASEAYGKLIGDIDGIRSILEHTSYSGPDSNFNYQWQQKIGGPEEAKN